MPLELYPFIDTPALVLDLAKMEANIREMADIARAAGVKLRPHIKTHKSPYIAKMQLAAGASGITVATLREAEAMADAGIPTVKLFMTYKGTPFYCTDNIIYRMLKETKKVGMTVFVHAENTEVISEMQEELIAQGKTEPRFHATSRPEVVEEEATLSCH